MQLQYNNKKTDKEITSIIELKVKELGEISLSKQGNYIFGDNFDSMCRLLHKYEGKIDLVYIDPPFNTNSTFYYNEVKTATISNSKDNLVAYEDNMTLDNYLEFMRERLILIHKLLSNKGTLYLHIDCKVGHYLKIILDEIFGSGNFLNEIARIKSNPKNFNRKAFGNQKDIIYIYAKNAGQNIFNNFTEKLNDDEVNRLFPKYDKQGKRYTTVPCHAPGETKNGPTGTPWRGILPPQGRHWRCSPTELEILDEKGLIEWSKNGNPRIKKFAHEHKGKKIQDVWLNFKDPPYPRYPTEKNNEMLEMIVAQSSNENSLVMDCFCGSGSFLLAALKLKRQVIGMDQSPVSKEVIINNSILKHLPVIES